MKWCTFCIMGQQVINNCKINTLYINKIKMLINKLIKM